MTRAAARPGSRRLRYVLAFAPLLIVLLAIPTVRRVTGSPGDEPAYLLYAQNLLDGGYALPRAGGWLNKGPGLPLVMAPFVALDLPLFLLREVGSACLFLAAVVSYKTLRLYFPPPLSLLGAYVVGLYPAALLLLRVLHNEPLAMLLAAITAHGLSVYFLRGRRNALVLAGLAFGGLAMTRVEFGWVAMVLLTASLLCWRWRVARSGVVVCAVALLVSTPWLIYTYSLSQRFFYWSDGGGNQIYWMAAPRAPLLGDWQSDRVFSDPRLAPERPLWARVRKLDPVKGDDALRREAFDAIKRKPLHYARNVILNASRIVFNVPYSFTPFKPTTAVFYGLPACALIMAFTFGIWRVPRPEFLAFAAIVAVAFVVHVLVSAYGRMFVPTVPMMVVPAVLAFDLVGQRIRLRAT